LTAAQRIVFVGYDGATAIAVDNGGTILIDRDELPHDELGLRAWIGAAVH
jgi:hypothetical protein